jgi:ABC-type multidrug transport system fused ATPase/permease subunit
MMGLIRRRIQAVQRMIVLLGIDARQLVALLALGIACAAFEGVGVGMLLPVLTYIEQGAGIFKSGNGSPITAFARMLTGVLGLSPTLPVLFTLAFLPVVARQLCRYAHQLYAGRTRFQAIARLRRRGVAAFLHARLSFFVSEGQGRLASVLTSEIERGAQALSLFLQFCEGLVLIGVYLILLVFVAAWLLPLVLLLMAVVGLLVGAKITKSRRYGLRISATNGALHSSIGEGLAGVRLIKMLAGEPAEIAKLSEIIGRLEASSFRISRLKEGIEVAIEPIMLLGAFVALYVAVTAFGMTLASLGLFSFILLRIVPLFRQVNVASQEISALVASLDNVHATIEEATALVEVADGPVVFGGLQRGIVFDDVSFTYENGHRALREVSLAVPRGSLTAIVGRSGAGKSTLLDLVPRLRDVSGGEIRIDDVPIRRFTLKSLRSGIGIVDQIGFLFNDTVANNIAYGRTGMRPEVVIDAARKAQAHVFIEALPEGYRTVVGERGVRLSVGQRQRLCLARVLLQDPDIMLLDEPTSALDSESEQAIEMALERLRRDKAIIVVAHRLSTIRRADQIIVLDEGRVVERGVHETLLRQWGTYKQLFELQIHA